MQLEKRVESTEKKFTETEEEKLFEAVISGRDITEEIETSRGKFKVKFLLPKDVMAVGRLIASRHGFAPANSFDGESDSIIIITSYLDIAVAGGPEWYEKAKKANSAFSFSDVPDEDFLGDLYQRSFQFRQSVKEKLQVKRKPEDKGPAAAAAADEAVGGGVFEGLSG
jgi:hypothetical protein